MGGKKTSRRYPEEIKAEVLKGLREAVALGTSRCAYAAGNGYNRKTLYNWERRDKENQLADKKPIAHNIPHKTDEQTRAEIIRVYEEHRRRYGPRALERIMDTVSYSTIDRVIKAHKKVRAKRYEFSRPDVCWSGDVMEIRGREHKLLLWHDEASRYKLIWDLGKEVNAKVVKTVLEMAFTKYRVPLILKHDNGPIFMAGDVQDFLKANGIISLASPPYYAMYNGKIERGFREIRAWIEDIEAKGEVECNEIHQGIAYAVYEENEVRPRLIFAGQTSKDSYYYTERLKVDRLELIKETDELAHELIKNLKLQKGGEEAKRKARRMAIENTLLRKQLCYYTNYEEVSQGCLNAESVKTFQRQIV